VADPAGDDRDLSLPSPEQTWIVVERDEQLLGSLVGVGVDVHATSPWKSRRYGDMEGVIRDFA
jgi:hypothetical protein